MLLSPPPAISLSKAGASAEPQSRQSGSSAARASGMHRPVTERIACWSARHAVLALIAWLVMTAGAVTAGHLYGTASQPQYDPGRSGVAERMLDALHVVTPPNESILIQPKTAGSTYATDPSMRLATGAVVAALQAMPGTAAHIRSPLGAGGSQLIAKGGRGVLITFQVAGKSANADTTVVRAMRAVSSVQARFGNLVIAEDGDASDERAARAMIGKDFRKVGTTSIPITLKLVVI